MNRVNQKNNRILPGGHWLVHYDPAQYSHGQIFHLLAQADDDLKQNPREPGQTFILSPGKPSHLETLSCDEQTALFNKIKSAFSFSIQRVGLSYPVLATDKRWDTIGLTTSSLFLGSSLKASGFDVKVKKQLLPVTGVDNQLLACDMLGFTLFEDLFIQTRDFLEKLRTGYRYEGLIAAGGPMVTLSPLQTAFHLPALNLLVRGEAELILPDILTKINRGDISGLLNCQGLLFQVPGLLILSDIQHIHRPGNKEFADFRFHLDFLEKEHMQQGLEINLSRGCQRSCIFCSAVQGKKLRKLPVKEFAHLLDLWEEKLDELKVNTPFCRTVNIDDDDILQDPEFTRQVFQVITAHGFRLWGVQTSIDSFFTTHLGGKKIAGKIIQMIANPGVFVENNPLVWCGTDTFLSERGHRLGKWVPDEQMLFSLVNEFEKQGIRNYHYLISSDHDSNWDELTRELILIFHLHKTFSYFGLIAHSPFLVPYPNTPVYRLLSKTPASGQRIIFKHVLKSPHARYDFPLVERVETAYPQLNRLLKNEKMQNRLGFFTYLGQQDFTNAFITVYNFLKQERLEASPAFKPGEADRLRHCEQVIEDIISRLL